MKFTEYFSGATLTRPSSLARGWDMPPVTTAYEDATPNAWAAISSS
jgi:hypothetical protein